MLHYRFFTAVLLCLSGLVFTQDLPKFEIAASMASSYQQGQADDVSISLKLTDAEVNFTEAVVFLNVVENAPPYPQAAHRIFASASETPKVFQTVYSADSLREGISTSLSFGLKDNAKPGSYSLVIQVFAGANTDPHGVKPDTRVAMRSFAFEITVP